MLRILLLVTLSLWLSSCAAKAPVQAMAEARAAVKSVGPLFDGKQERSEASRRYFQSAEQALDTAIQALNEQDYDLAQRKATEAKHKARFAAKFK